MATGTLNAWLDGERERLRWIEFAEYAGRVFAAGNPQWLVDPHVYTGSIAQAQGVIATEVLSIEVLAPYLATLEADGDPSDALTAMFENKAAAAFSGEVVDAFAHSLGSAVDLVLKIPSPAHVLRAAGAAATPSFDDLDDTAIALANVLRGLSGRPVSAILVTTSTALSDDEAEALESVVSAARHYDWRVAVSFDPLTAADDDAAALAPDVTLYPATSFAALAGRGATGGGLDASFWSGQSSPPDAARYLAYGIVPADAQPETVVAQAAALKAV